MVVGAAGGRHVIAVNVRDGTNQRVGNATWGFARYPRWLPDGKGLLLTARQASMPNYQVWRISYPNGEVNSVTNDLGNYQRISIMKDGQSAVSVQHSSVSSVWIGASKQMRKLGFGAGRDTDLT
jgi:Tol biopolymer transport system component